MTSSFRQLSEVLKQVKNPGNFAIGGIASNLDLRSSNAANSKLPYYSCGPTIQIGPDRYNFDLKINGTAFSSDFEQKAKAIAKFCSQAPYGRGQETIVDTSVRRTWQLDPSQFTLMNIKWMESLDTLVEEIKIDLGCDESLPVSCELYKLLLYEPGGFFKPHRDTEKVDGMFGTLVIQLPSDYKGGQLVVYHQGEKKIFDFSDNPWNFYYATFYADCPHEICEVTEGYRLCLIYNLISRTPQTVPLPIPSEDNSETVDLVVKIITEWTADDKDPSVMAHLLDHKYSGAGLSFNSLKNRDRAVAEVLLNARKQVDFDMHLAIMSRNEEWWTPYYGEDGEWYCAKYGGYGVANAMDFRLEKSSFHTNQSMVTPDGRRKWMNFSSLEKQLEELFSSHLPSDMEVERDVTGNEGTTVTRSYCHAILVLSKNKNS